MDEMDEIRISGLEAFSGDTSASDYLAIDNATNGTKKISATALLANAKGENVISFTDSSDGEIVITLL